ncbi:MULTISPECIES: hypothetical protein [Chitinophagaceae]
MGSVLGSSTNVLADAKKKHKKKDTVVSYFPALPIYNAASWMGDLLLREKGNYTLKDIVFPGSHDAGMSVLTAAGGQQKGTINECNTLTQIFNISEQLNDGIRMFDLRVGMYENEMYTKHCASDCMDDAMGGGYGERLRDILLNVKDFLHQNNKEIVLLTFSHFCERVIGPKRLTDSILQYLGKDIVFRRGAGMTLAKIPLSQMSGKVILSFEGYMDPTGYVDSGTIAYKSDAFINFRRRYAATNKLENLLLQEKNFFAGLNNSANANDLVRLDWQLTQSADEAAMSCNAFESEHAGILLNTTIFIINKIRKHKSIIGLAKMGNALLVPKLQDWITNGTINEVNKPNILYVDIAGKWITDYCIYLNNTKLYTPISIR